MPRRRRAELTAAELVTDLHPYHEWSAAHTRAAAGELAELVRYLNHATQYPEALPNPDAVGELLQQLGQSVRRLPQLLQQAAARMESLAADSDLMFRRDEQPAAEAPAQARAVGGELASALGDRLDELGQEIERASFAARRLALRRDPPPPPSW
jgi:hypothetical protein